MSRRLEVEQVGELTITVGLVSSYPPRRCGIASFAADLAAAMRRAAPALRVAVVAVDPAWEPWQRQAPFAGGVQALMAIDADRRDQYREAAHWLAEHGCRVVCLQHEYGLFGGPHGSYVLELVDQLPVPLVTTLHTVLRHPVPQQRAILRELARRSRVVVAQARSALELLVRLYEVDARRVVVIPHGTPAFTRWPAESAKAALGLSGRPVLLTYGLIGPGKGIEQALAAVREVAARYPQVVYLVAGQTHPNVRKWMGESYREHLARLAQQLGVGANVRFIDRYLELAELEQLLAAADVYVTPYPNEEQVVSGTLSYALAAGKAVVSTPFRHAREVLSGGRGLLCRFDDPSSMAREILRLLDNPELRRVLEHRAYAFGQSLSWDIVGARYARLLGWVASEQAGREAAPRPAAGVGWASAAATASRWPLVR